MSIIVVFKLTNHSGFFSIFFFLIKAYIYAKKNGYLFYIQHEDWIYTYEKGWHDYFKSLNIFDGKNIFSKVIYYGHQNFLENSYKNNPITLVEYTFNDYIEAINEVFILNDDIIQKANTIVKSMAPEFGSIFIRRGDKITSGESPFFSTSNIFYYTNLLNYKHIFVQSDSYDTILELKELLPSINIYSTVSESKKGCFHLNYFTMSKDKIKDDTEEMLVGLYICLKSKNCWTDDYSNVGRFLKLANSEKVLLYPLSKNDYYKGYYRNDIFNTNLKIKCPSFGQFNNLILNT
jgi:hypothetical protein